MTKSTTAKLTRTALLGSASLALMISAAHAEQVIEFKIKSGPLVTALNEYARQSEQEILFSSDIVAGKEVSAINGVYEPTEALELILAETGLVYVVDDGDTVLIKDPTREAAAPRSFRVAQVDQENDIEEIDPLITDEEERIEDVIVVTGTNIRGVQNPTSPVFVYDKEDIRLSGAATAQDFIRTLPQNLDLSEASAGGLAGPDNGLGGGGAGVNIRGLGATATLTLVNGRRLAAGAGAGNFVDISLIPLSAIERVEVLTDGASAIYGADAVAGVVNFILREDYDGAESQIRVGTATTGRGSPKEFQASQTAGKAWSTGNVMASYEYYRRNNLDSSDRPFTEAADDPLDLAPNQQRHSVLLNARQDLSESLEVFGTANFSSRQLSSNQTVGFGTGTQFDETADKQFGGNISLQYNFANEWRAQLSGGYNRNETDALFFIDREFDRGIDTAFNIWTADFVADGELFRAPGGAARLAIGGHYRTERFERVIERTNFVSILDIDRNVYAAFAEVVLPIVGENNRRAGVYALDITAAGRFEHFSDVGSSANPKVGLRYAPIESVSFRGTYSTAFQAPRFFDLGSGQLGSVTPGVFFPTAPGSTAPNPAVLSLGGGNPDLEPETSRNFTVGVDYSPVFAPNAKLKLTYFDIDFKDRVGVPGPSVLQLFVAPEAFGDALIFDPDPSVVTSIYNDPTLTFFNFFGVPPEDVGAFLDARVQNLSSTEVRGLDIDFSYDQETPIGNIIFAFNGSYLLDFIDQASAVSDPVSALNTVGNPVDFRFRSNIGWSHEGFGVNIFVNYVDGYKSDLTNMDATVQSWTTVDFNLSYDARFSARTSLLNNTRFNLNIRNLFNEDPPFVERPQVPGLNFDGANANPLGRYLSFSVAKAW